MHWLAFIETASDWLTTSWLAVLMVLLSTAAIYGSVILLTRLVGLRSFSKMSSFDFAMTVAVGSLVAATILTKDPPLLQAVAALACVYGLQFTLGKMRQRWRRFSHVVDNEPILLMHGADMIEENLRKAQVTEDDLWAKLREANVLDLAQVRAVVLETTGDISVLHGEADGTPLDPVLLTGVQQAGRRYERDDQD